MVGTSGKGYNYSCYVLVNLKMLQNKMLKKNTLCSQMSFLVVLGSNGHGGHGLLYFVPHHTPNTEPSAW